MFVPQAKDGSGLAFVAYGHSGCGCGLTAPDEGKTARRTIDLKSLRDSVRK